ncbi:phosphoadenylyl-sulfate reductase [Alicyclobacillus ferrooxydans]|uniref:Adenosine 5'-phosphosulfate reductase n=1 Tax=Alicyclobacillus ferrooxydans TaxID=471514 RepID=A0A0P9GKX5_9BACL|nr:phosphoadenylyl-sulfate reductase [Alicyclobacillus ferrooxydans]KPV40771.1 phosphoadenosine phosphosulfate reductase [Alicyclobacillus ferrooxydans]
MAIVSDEQVVSLAETFEFLRPEEILAEALKRIPNLALACSFGAEDMVLLDMLMNLAPETKVFYLDTDVLFQETYDLIEEAKQRYTIPNLIRVNSTLTLKEQAEIHGDALWTREPDRCCNIRKVQPLTEMLSTLDGWITGIRRDQTAFRAGAQAFEQDYKFGLIKVNPLICWTEGDVWQYIRDNNVPYNPLHDQGYPSIGCVHCTRAVKPGEDSRSGRWSGFVKTECGLHK